MMSHLCFTIPKLLTGKECDDFISWGESEHYAPTGNDYPVDYRNNDRLVAHRESLAQKLWQRLCDHLPRTLERQGKTWILDSLNPQFRGCRYQGGQSFARHRDGAYSPDDSRMSLLTVMLYLNDRSEFTGGSTRFYEDRYCDEISEEVAPEAGLAVVFDHDYWHDGQAVTEGTKYVLRTDVLYRLESGRLEGHRGYVWDMVSLPDANVVTGSRDRTVRVWDVNGPTPLQRQVLAGHKASVTCLAPTPVGFVSGGRDRLVIDWARRLSGEYCERRRFLAHDGALLKLLSTKDGGLLSAGADNSVKLWAPERRLTASLSTDGWPWAIVPWKDGFLVGTESGTLLKVSSDLSKTEVVFRHSSPIRGLGPADGKLCPADGGPGLADGKIGLADGEIGLADGEIGPADGEIGLADGEIGPADGGPGPADGEIGPADGKLSSALWKQSSRENSTSIVLGDARGALLFLNSEFEVLRRTQAHRGPVTCLLKAGDWIVSGGEDDGVRAWSPTMSTELWNHRDFVRALCRHGNRLVSASYDGSLQLSRPSAIWRTALEANPGGTRSGTVAAS